MKRLHTYKSFKILNEELTEENIEKDPNTDSSEKEDQMIKLNIDQYNTYKSKKGVFDRMFNDIETEIDVPTLNKLIDDNPFLKDYSELLHKNRDGVLIEKTIKEKEEKISQLKQEISDLNTSDSDTFNEGFFDNEDDSIDNASDKRKQISELQSEISDLKDQLSQKDTSGIMNKWSNQLLKTIRDLKKGKPMLMSTLSHLR
tara:strand:- start:5567 stop:6169 length:603 start_codon:yes stop_codon:yes gene_type:complete